MEYGQSILPKDAAMYDLYRANIQGGILHLSAGGYLKYTIRETDIVNLTEYFRVSLIADPPTDRYVPRVRIHIHLETADGEFYNDALFPTEFKSGIYMQELQLKAGKYNSFTFEIIAKEDISFSLWELCPEAADEDIQVIIEGVEQSLPRLLYDYNTWPLLIDQSEKTIALVTFRLLDNTDLQGHFQMTYVASEACTLTLRFKDNGATELFAPLLYDLHAGRGSVGVPHAYLHRLAGIHSVIVTAQVTSGTLTIDTRGILFTIDGGYLAERMLDIGVDVRDITIRQLFQDYGPDEIWIVGIEAGEALVRKRKYDPMATISFTPMYSVGPAVEAAIEFDGDWVLRTSDTLFTLETYDTPWIFWVDPTGALYGQLGDIEGTKVLFDTEVSKVYACRGFSSMYYQEQDQGLVVAYVKNGQAYYVQYGYNSISKEYDWSDSFILDDALTDVLNIAVQRLNDYRLGFTVVLPNEARLYITDRTYVAQAVPKEVSYTSIMDNTVWLYCPVDTDLSVNASIAVSEDLLTFTITLDRLLKVFSYDLRDVVTLDDSVPEENIKDITWQNKKDTSEIIIQLSKVPTKLITKVYLNKAQSNDIHCLIEDYGAITCPVFEFVVDTTLYTTLTIPSEVSSVEVAGAILYTPISLTNATLYEEASCAISSTIEYKAVTTPTYRTDTEGASCTIAAEVLYTQTGTVPV